MMIFLATPSAPSEPWKTLINIIFFIGTSALVAWYFYFYLKKEILGKFLGATIIAGVGALISFALLQNLIRDIIFWLMSPKIGGTTQLSNINLIAVFGGAYFALYIMNRINHNKTRRD